MRRLTLLLAGAALWLFLAAVPALADGGPHVASVNNGSSSLTADSCAGCHRVHTAQGPMLLKTATEEELCLSCHGAASTGATTDVHDRHPVRVRPPTAPPRPGPPSWAPSAAAASTRRGSAIRSATTVGTRRLWQGPGRVGNARGRDLGPHRRRLGGLTQPGIAWGNGANGSGAGPAATVSCGSCHNPHGNGQYRILNKIPAATGVNAAWVIQVFDYGVVAPNAYRSVSSMGVLNGDLVAVAGNTLAGANTAAAGLAITMVDGPDSGTVPDDNLFTLAGVTAAGTGRAAPPPASAART